MLSDARSGDPDALAALDAHGRWLGIGLASVINVLDPTMVVLGGVLGEAYPLVADRVEHELARRTMSGLRETVEIVRSALDIDGPLLGAAELAWDPVLVDPVRAVTVRAAHSG